jgi:hypothetical protein
VRENLNRLAKKRNTVEITELGVGFLGAVSTRIRNHKTTEAKNNNMWLCFKYYAKSLIFQEKIKPRFVSEKSQCRSVERGLFS